ncbi:hypothetical protein [Streptosporangium sp. NPDC087985]|uniref:hypothetical protein n=1 Tax=Streptosporangium sp. NPDC087985 TaxID=3366196 RepID=UPI0038126962
MRRRFSKGIITILVIVTVLAVGLTAGFLILLNRVTSFTAATEGCKITIPTGSLELEIEQAQVAAVIAAVAARRKLPERAVVIAYATAIQESKLLNLPFGDRDSVGVFQQRPSQGWGRPEQLVDPVYSSGKFFSALVKVKHYQKLPLHEAAQKVQRSADGSAYAQHEGNAEILAAAFTGRVPKAVHCWFPAPTGKTPLPGAAAAKHELARALGSGTTLNATSQKHGWLMSSWSVAHAQEFGLHRVRYSGQAWTPESADRGWQADAQAPAGRVEIS